MNEAFFKKLFYKYIPTFFSVVLHPLVMPTIGVYVILNSGTHISFLPLEAKNLIIAIVLTLTCGLPVAFLPLYKNRQIIMSVEMDTKNERLFPLVVTAILYFASYWVMRSWGVPYIIQAFLLSSAVAVFVTFIVTTQWKISAHSVGIGGIIGLIACISIMYRVDMIFDLMLSIILAGFVGYSRLSLNAHTPAEVYSGLGIGVSITSLIMWLF